MIVSFEERRLIELFRRCSDEGKEGLIVSAEVLAQHGQETNNAIAEKRTKTGQLRGLSFE